MGQGFTFTCAKCGYVYSVHPGSGFMYPDEYQELLQNIESGRYGEERQRLLKETPYAAVNAETFVYICRSCGHWGEGKDITLYAPNNPEAIPHKQYGIKTVEEWGYVPYVMQYELVSEYHVLKRHYHICSKCHKKMHKASDEELCNLSCPKCGTVNGFNGAMFWD